MERQLVPRPASDCGTCQQHYQRLVDLYRMIAAVPGDPGARGLFDAAREDDEVHHRQIHPGHVNQRTEEQTDASDTER